MMSELSDAVFRLNNVLQKHGLNPVKELVLAAPEDGFQIQRARYELGLMKDQPMRPRRVKVVVVKEVVATVMGTDLVVNFVGAGRV